MTRTRKINDHGIGLASQDARKKIKDIRVYDENGSVQIWFELADGEYLQYLTPDEAREFGKAFEQCARAAIRSRPLQVGDMVRIRSLGLTIYKIECIVAESAAISLGGKLTFTTHNLDQLRRVED